MEKQYTVKSSYALGDKDEKYGQAWICDVQEMSSQVMFNLMTDDRVNIDDRLSFDEEIIKTFKSGKNQGKEYRRLKKVKLTPGSISQSEEKQGLDETPTEIQDEPVNLEDIPF